MNQHVRRATAVLSLLVAGTLTGCGSEDSSLNGQDAVLANANIDALADVLPTQTQITGKQSFAYLMASPVTSTITPESDSAAAHRPAATLKDKAEGTDTAQRQVNEKCAVYEQTAIGLFSTPSASWNITEGVRRSIIIGQSGIDQITGYASVLATADQASATALFNDFKSNSTSCSEALKALYPSKADQFNIQSPSVDAGSGTVTLRGIYDGKSFNISISHSEKYLFSTWFTTAGTGGDTTIKPATETVHSIMLENISLL